MQRYAVIRLFFWRSILKMSNPAANLLYHINYIPRSRDGWNSPFPNSVDNRSVARNDMAYYSGQNVFYYVIDHHGSDFRCLTLLLRWLFVRQKCLRLMHLTPVSYFCLNPDSKPIKLNILVQSNYRIVALPSCKCTWRVDRIVALPSCKCTWRVDRIVALPSCKCTWRVDRIVALPSCKCTWRVDRIVALPSCKCTWRVAHIGTAFRMHVCHEATIHEWPMKPPYMKPPYMKPPYMKPPYMKPPDMKPPDMKPPDMKPPDMKPPDMKPPDMKPPDMSD